MTEPLVRIENLGKTFGGRRRFGRALSLTGVRAVDGVTFDVGRGETVAVVGESGCGKSTLGRLVLRLIEPTDGHVAFDGRDVVAMSAVELREMRRHAQIIFQDPYGSLSPRRTVAQIVSEPLEVLDDLQDRRARRERVAELLTQVGLSPSVMDRHPRSFSGGQRQRIGIARAIAVNPKFIVADEPVSALDVSVQAQIVNLLQDLQEKHRFSCLFISHNLAIVRHIADRVVVMYLGRVVEIADKQRLYSAPQHPYTQALLSAVPEPDPDRPRQRIVLTGDMPSPSRVPSGCSFHTRCPQATDICRSERPLLREIAPGQIVACHFPGTTDQRSPILLVR
ncbi:MAG: dipeptide ABC transporter ATP-binding protein [Proteobacteria bacterium]|nr:dipeptide ABC transporter ATP-binding protein [Pseudomonadota bacterium]